MKFLQATIIALTLCFPPVVVFAQTPDTQLAALVPACEGKTCSACNLIELANNGIQWLITISFLFFAVLAVRAGIKLVVSQGNAGALQDAKSSFTNAFIGLIIILVAFILVDTIMRQLVKGNGNIEGYGPWSEVRCATQVDSTLVPNSFAGDPEFTPPPTNYGTLAAPDPTADGQFTYQSGISAQRIHASAALNRMLNCLATKLPANVGEISSISDGRIISGSKTWSQCRLGGQSVGCAHTDGSLHYGGSGSVGQCGDKSFAVDFGDEQNVRTICAAANSCGRNNCSVHNGNHVHLSVPIVCN